MSDNTVARMLAGLAAYFLLILGAVSAEEEIVRQRPSAEKYPGVAKESSRGLPLTIEGNATPDATNVEALTRLLRDMDSADVTRAAHRFADALKRSVKQPLDAELSVRLEKRDGIIVGEKCRYDVEVILTAPARTAFGCYGLMFVTGSDAEDVRFLTSAGFGGDINGRVTSRWDGLVPTGKPGDYKLITIVVGRNLPDGKYDYYGSQTVRYSVKPAMAK